VDLGRVLIGHCGDSTDIDYLEALIDSGSMIGMDRFGLDFRLPFEPRIDTIVRLCEKGYADRMVLSQDAACYSDQLGDELVREKLPNWHHLHIAQDVLPELRRRGVSDGQLDQMLVTNPRKFFSSS
jgi:phosphotriesterase-related protein